MVPASFDAYVQHGSTQINCIRIWQSNIQFHFFGAESQQLAKVAGIDSSALSAVNEIPCLAISAAQLDPLIKECLCTLKKRVEVWTQQKEGWSVTRQGSLVNPLDFATLLTDQDLYDVQESCNTCGCASLWIECPSGASFQVSFVTCALDSERQFLWTCYESNSVEDVSSLLDVIVAQLGIKEFIVSKGLLKHSALVEFAEQFSLRNGISLSFSDGARATTKSIQQLLNSSTAINEIADNETVLSLLASLVSWLELDRFDSNLGTFAIHRYNPGSFMVLEGNVQKSLHLFPGPNSNAKYSSLFGLLNRCVTRQGSRLLANWIRQPLVDLAQIQQRLDCVEFFINDSSTRKQLHEQAMRSLPDFSMIISRLQRDKGSLESVVKLYDACKSVHEILNTLEESPYESDVIKCVFVAEFQRLNSLLEKFCTLVETSVDFDALQVHEYRIKGELVPELAELQQQKSQLLATINSEFLQTATQLHLEAGKKIKLEVNSMYGYFMRVTRNDAHLVRNCSNPKQFVELATQKNGIYFSTQLMRTASLENDTLSREYDQKQSEVVREIVQVTRTYSKEFLMLGNLVAHLDVLLAFATVSVSAPTPYCKPRLTVHDSDSSLVLEGVRHPCLEMHEQSFITNNLQMNHSNREMLIVTGPNMGGKSTFIRQVALVAILAQIGSFVPCSSATLPLFDRILTRVGANDQLMRGISTFMLEMLDSARMLRYANTKSLVIVDELGRGTSTHDGFGLAWSIANDLSCRIGCFCLFATHFHELTRLPNSCPKASNVHVSASVTDNELTFGYGVAEGPSEKSFGIHVARICRFPEIVLDIANRKAAQLESQPNKLS